MTIDSTAARALIAAGRKHDEAMTSGPWCGSSGFVRMPNGDYSWCQESDEQDGLVNAAGIAWMRTNLRALLDGYVAALAEVDRLAAALAALQPLLAAARQLAPNWRDTSGSMTSVDAINEGCEAVVRAVETIDGPSKESA